MYAHIIGNPATPFINALARQGALFTRSFAITHPSEPNYLALFSGSTQGVTNDGCPDQFTTPNLAADLIKAGESFAGYAEDLPSTGSSVCAAGEYARKHVPWADFGNVPGSVSKPFTSFPKTAFARLPAVSFVIPNLCDDMHDCSASAAIPGCGPTSPADADWAMKHDSLLILTWDEDDGSQANQIPTIFAGQLVQPGRYAEAINHYRVLATIEAAYSCPATATRPPWRRSRTSGGQGRSSSVWYSGARAWAFAMKAAWAAASSSGGASVRVATGAPTARNIFSCPGGEQIHSRRAGRPEELVKACGALAGTWTVSPARAIVRSPRKVSSTSPSSTLNVSSKSCRCGGDRRRPGRACR